ncbi:helix-turn-helix domain-containing protein [Hymenobacter armeniacus]|uniref:AraC family transcriptional regulator n=1 Tax=Hymenobacter armeniacus TaxID=2771358 RepID=A0ABR8JNI7_9BACT|nr:AraC family transcriptional regulator [Hymenobacter armeniacus]MBD2720837.1 AraC family transcriptional regulator [Hymenobacter armeniacus]
MHITAFSPSPELSGFVECYGLWHNDPELGPPTAATAHSPPADLPPFSAQDPLGFARRMLWLRLPGRDEGLSIFFRPAGLYHLFGLSLAEGRTARAGPGEAALAFVNALLHRMQEAGSHVAWPAAADELLLAHAAHTTALPDAVDAVAGSILRQEGRVSIEALAQGVGLSRRQLERRFLAEVGTAPKLYASLVRFNHAFRLLAASPAPNWQDVAYACGYYDQAHLIREFRRFTGQAPSAFFKANPEQPIPAA